MSAPTPWFAFSLALAPELLPERLPGPPLPALPEGEVAEALDVDLVYDVPAQPWEGRVARLVAAPGKRVVGRVREVPPAVWPQVARLERALALASQERPVQVRTASGVVVTARAFTTPTPRVRGQGLVSVPFLVALARAAEHAKLPAPYIEKLQAEAHLVQRVQDAHAHRLTRS